MAIRGITSVKLLAEILANIAARVQVSIRMHLNPSLSNWTVQEKSAEAYTVQSEDISYQESPCCRHFELPHTGLTGKTNAH